MQEEAARQQVPHGRGFGKGGAMVPSIMSQNSFSRHTPNSMGNVVEAGNICQNMPNSLGAHTTGSMGNLTSGQMGIGGNQVMGNNLSPRNKNTLAEHTPGGIGNVVVTGNSGQMGLGGNQVMGNNLSPMDQWGGNRYPNNMRQPNQNPQMPQNPMQQQVSISHENLY